MGRFDYNHVPYRVQIFEGCKFHEFRGRQHFCEILVLHIRILATIDKHKEDLAY